MTAKDIEYRVNRADATCFITTAAHADKMDAVAASCPTLHTRIIVGSERDGWIKLRDGIALAAGSPDFPTADTAGDENAICYFTSGTTGYPKMTLHTHSSYPLGHMTTGKYWLDQRPGQLHWNISDTGLGQGGLEQLFWSLELWVNYLCLFNQWLFS